MIEIKRYGAGDKVAWNDFLLGAKNSVFLYHRDYMDYHADRFIDHSLIIYKKGSPVAVLPANEKGYEIISHGGLTFGGLVHGYTTGVASILEIFSLVVAYYKAAGFNALVYKSVPYIFHKYPAQEDLYALFRLNARLIRRDVSSVCDLANPLRFSETKRQAIAKCKKAGVAIKEATSFEQYWALLTSVLSKFGSLPVHSLEEFILLQGRFPCQIKLYEARLNDQLLAGVVIYDYGTLVHTQYMANSDEGRKIGALDFLNHVLISEVYRERQYYSFGISTESDGQKLNEGLALQKEMMGARAITLDFYKITFA
jgi:hypothetical protein